MTKALSKNYWYVEMSGASNFAINDENYERLKKAMLDGVPAIEITGEIGETLLVNTRLVAHIDESTPEIREYSYLWNKQSDEENLQHKKEHGTAKDFSAD